MKSIRIVLSIHSLLLCFVVNAQQNNNITTAVNGLNKPSNNSIGLGGTLNAATAVDLGASFTFKFSKGASNFFFLDNSGKIGVGIGTPTALLHLKEGTTSANTAPIKFTSGVGLTTPEDGAMEYHNSHLYFTIGSTRYQLDQQGAGAASPSLNSTYVAYGSAANLLTGSSNLTFDNTNKILGVTDRGIPIGLARNGLLPRAYIVHGTNNYGLAVVRAENDAGGANLILYHTRNNNAAIPISVAVNDYLGNITWMGVATNNSVQVASEITSYVENVNTDIVSGRITFKTADQTGALTERMRLTGDGNVGIGTTNTQGYRLAVNGNAIFIKVKVKQYSTWPDYVFYSPFELLPLKDLEKYLERNKHLPDVPSAKEVEENGLDLGDNQSVLLKKIEELTLYIIGINKKVEKLSAERAQLKKKLGTANK